MSDTINTAIHDFEALQVRRLATAAIEKINDLIDSSIADKDHNFARSLVEKIHLIAGDRRMQHISVRTDRRQP